MATARKTKRIDPFTTKKVSAKKASDKDSLDPRDPGVKAAVDDYVEAAIKEAEGNAEKIAPKDTVESSFARREFAQRFCNGKEDSFYIQGNEHRVIFITADKSDVSSEEELAEIANKWGRETVDRLFEKDYGSVRLNDQFVKENFDRIIPKLVKALGDDFQKLFTEAKYKGVNNIAKEAREIVDNDPVRFEELHRDLKIRSFIKK